MKLSIVVQCATPHCYEHTVQNSALHAAAGPTFKYLRTAEQNSFFAKKDIIERKEIQLFNFSAKKVM